MLAIIYSRYIDEHLPMYQYFIKQDNLTNATSYEYLSIYVYYEYIFLPKNLIYFIIGKGVDKSTGSIQLFPPTGSGSTLKTCRYKVRIRTQQRKEKFTKFEEFLLGVFIQDFISKILTKILRTFKIKITLLGSKTRSGFDFPNTVV